MIKCMFADRRALESASQVAMGFPASLVRVTAIVFCMTVTACATGPSAPSVAGAGIPAKKLGVGVFEGEDASVRVIGGVLQADLRRGGIVPVVDGEGAWLGSTQVPNWEAWSARGAGAVGGGRVLRLAGGKARVEFRLWDVAARKEIAGIQFDADTGDLRRLGHALADFAQEKLAGIKGTYTERRARVDLQHGRYALSVADSDGADPQVALTSRKPMVLPTWTSDRRSLAYVSIETPTPTVWLQDVESGLRQPAAPAASLADACPSYVAFLVPGPSADPPGQILDDAWDGDAGAACKAALLLLAGRAEAAVARLRLGLPARPVVKPDSEMNWAERIAKAVRQNVIFPLQEGAGLSGNPAAEFDVRLAPDGTILGAVLKKSSGVPDWDGAALRGILRTERLPLDGGGRAPPVLVMSMRPFR